jgi:hypothetical protein
MSPVKASSYWSGKSGSCEGDSHLAALGLQEHHRCILHSKDRNEKWRGLAQWLDDYFCAKKWYN